MTAAVIAADLQALAVPTEGLELLPGNPRRGDIGAVAASLAKFGQRKPIVVRRSDHTVVAGNHTLQAAQRTRMVGDRSRVGRRRRRHG